MGFMPASRARCLVAVALEKVGNRPAADSGAPTCGSRE
ncbi:hypothetical protein DB30_05824 [Enhygromyxa salina]|uniref:Uncharacterized protein n=1 Tax=Enhygromyxa salina TaxID=215803 RepID=A0A0C2D0C3_9BACT|nr:hypothetical protein DB30_05824 [Enhygromyxa salina]